MSRKRRRSVMLVVIGLLSLQVATSAVAQSISPTETRAIVKEAYIYGFPLVDSYRIQYSYFVDRNNPEFKGATNPSESALMARFAKVNVGAGKTFDPKSLSPEMQKAVQDGMADAWKAFDKFKKTEIDTGKFTSADGFGTRAFLRNVGGENMYMFRMTAAVLGIYGNSKEEALYPAYFVDSAGQKLDGSHHYALRFALGQMPPVNAFWSLTMYELPASLLYANPLNRYLINSPMLQSLKRDADGGITLYPQNDRPAADKDPNWLPAPKGPFFTVLRLYWPKPEALDGKWKQPPLRRID